MNPSLIVCPIEFSANGKSVLALALALTRWHDAELHVLYVRPGGGRRATLATTTDDPFHLRLVDFVKSLNPTGVRINPVVLTGDPAKAVVEYAQLKSADLVVVGQNGRRASRYWTSGTFATAVARTVQSSTIMVRSDTAEHADTASSFSNIICAVDFSIASVNALKQALTVAQQSGGRITLLHVLEGLPHETVYSGSRAFQLIGECRARVEKVTRELRALVPPDALSSCEVETSVVSGIAHSVIVAVAAERSADLVVIGMPQRMRLDRIVMGSTVAGVHRRARCPVMTVPALSRVVADASGRITARGAGSETTAALASLATRGVASGTGTQNIEAM